MLTTTLALIIQLVQAVLNVFIGLLPRIEVDTLPIIAPKIVSDSLTAVNYFINIQDLVTIGTLWASAVIVYNIVNIASSYFTRYLK